MRARKPVLVTVSVLGGLIALVGITVLPAFVGFVLAVAIAMVWCSWLEHHPAVDASTFRVWSHPLEISMLPQERKEMQRTG